MFKVYDEVTIARHYSSIVIFRSCIKYNLALKQFASPVINRIKQDIVLTCPSLDRRDKGATIVSLQDGSL